MKLTKWMIVFDVIVVMIAVGAALLFIQSYKQIQSPNEIKIGVIESLSGNAAYYGEQNMKGVEIAKEEMQAKYPDFKIEVVHEDSQYTAQGGVAAYRKIKELQTIDAVITHASPVSLAVQPLANNNSILQMAVSSSAKTYSSLNDLSFRVSPTTDIEADAIVNFIHQMNYQNVSIFYMNNDIGLSIANSVKSKLGNSSVAVSEEGFDLGITDFRTMLTKAKDLNAKALFVPALASHNALMLKQAKEIGFNAQLIGFRASEDPILIQNAGELAEGFIYSYGFDPDSNNSETEIFVNAYRTRYNEIPDGYAAEGYEGARLAILALASCNKNLECAKNYLENLSNYMSVFGNLSFDKNGDVHYKFYLKTVKNGTFVRYP